MSRLLPIVRHSVQTPSVRTFFGRGYDPFSGLSSIARNESVSMDRCMTDMIRQMDRTVREMEKVAENSWRTFPSFWSRTRNVPVETSTSGNMYSCKVNLEGFTPENINVTLVDGNVTIKAKKETKDANGNSLREAVYCYSLPNNVNTEALRSRLESDGTLVLEAPLLKLEEPKSQEIPIDKSNNSKK
ncbi:heat shock protein beta-11-like protein [Leptotrombidium deliense]|uniref:Heat shock protein beta-11-like protein n=1 Tax=Leptotrombidium deliense TaxID=299467 RepID=A0A443S9C2_9ACAR|nr:heat shock protein beta-11-like protein [Leptotrombidium deliense]